MSTLATHLQVKTDVQNKPDAEKGLQRGGSIINVASFVAKLGAATPQLACMFDRASWK